MAKAPVEQRTCPECDFIAKNVHGLRGHRQFKHGIKPGVLNQATLERQKYRFVSEDKLEEIKKYLVSRGEWDKFQNDQTETYDRWREEINALQRQVFILQQQLQATEERISRITHTSPPNGGEQKLLQQDMDLLWSTFSEHIHLVSNSNPLPRTYTFVSLDEEINERISEAKKRQSN